MGGGVVNLLLKHAARMGQMGVDVVVKTVACRSLDKERDFTLPAHTTLTTDLMSLVADPEIDCVVELIGGVGAAKELVFAAIAAEKHVVTANKALLAQYLPEIQQLLAKHPKATIGYEAAVCGGIPIINTLQTDYVGDNIEAVMGIMNGAWLRVAGLLLVHLCCCCAVLAYPVDYHPSPSHHPSPPPPKAPPTSCCARWRPRGPTTPRCWRRRRRSGTPRPTRPRTCRGLTSRRRFASWPSWRSG